MGTPAGTHSRNPDENISKYRARENYAAKNAMRGRYQQSAACCCGGFGLCIAAACRNEDQRQKSSTQAGATVFATYGSLSFPEGP